MARIMISLDPKEKAALIELALREYRDPRLQASLIIRRELERKRLLESKTPPDVGNNGVDRDQVG